MLHLQRILKQKKIEPTTHLKESSGKLQFFIKYWSGAMTSFPNDFETKKKHETMKRCLYKESSFEIKRNISGKVTNDLMCDGNFCFSVNLASSTIDNWLVMSYRADL